MLLETYKHQIISVSYLIVSMLAFVAVGWEKEIFSLVGWRQITLDLAIEAI